MKFTEGCAAKIKVPAGKAEVVIFEEGTPGFGIRKFADGRAVYFVRYLAAGARRKMTLGPCKSGVLADMRKRAVLIVSDAKRGSDPVTAKRTAAKAQKAAKENALGKLVEQYLAQREGELRPRYRTEIERHLRRDWAPLHERYIRALTRADAVRVIDSLAKHNGKRSADAAKTSLSAFFGWCMERQLADINPVAGISRRANGGSRERVLSPAELTAIWNACNDGGDYSRLVRLLLLTGARREEISGLRWSEIDLAAREIRLPAERCKNNRAHTIFLSDLALEILQSIPRRDGREYVFGAGSGPFSGYSRCKARLDARLGDTVGAWRVHDLRRTFATIASDHDMAGIHVVEAALSHVSGSKGGIISVYNKARHLRERRVLMDRWADFVRSLVDGRESNIVPLPVKAG